MPPARSQIRQLSAAALLAAALTTAGCRRPPAENGSATTDNVPPATTVAQEPSAVAQADDMGLPAAVARILAASQRSGSLVEHCTCGGGRMVEAHRAAPAALQPVNDALKQLAASYPEIKWSESANGMVRIRDSRAAAGLLKVRIKEFLVIEDRPPQAVMPALWRTEEVRAYMRRHNVRLVESGTSLPRVTRTAPTVIQVKNASVADILDRIIRGYRSGKGQPLYHAWIYRECRAGTETLVDISLQ